MYKRDFATRRDIDLLCNRALGIFRSCFHKQYSTWFYHKLTDLMVSDEATHGMKLINHDIEDEMIESLYGRQKRE
jgi:hypothetical protein